MTIGFGCTIVRVVLPHSNFEILYIIYMILMIINVMGQALSPIYLHKVGFAWLLVYNQSLTTAPGSRLFGSVVRALVSRVRFPAKAREIFQLCLTLLRLSCRKINMYVDIT